MCRVEQGGKEIVKACIHRGSHQIGGTCVELEAEGKRLVLDVGMPLDAADSDDVPLPDVKGLKSRDPSLVGVVISHPHQDHYGLADRLPANTPFLLGEAAERILNAAADFTPSGGTFDSVLHLEDRKAIRLGPFRITPHLANDYASYVVETMAEKGFSKKKLLAKQQSMADVFLDFFTATYDDENIGMAVRYAAPEYAKRLVLLIDSCRK